ncbi:hypothetical protein NEIRO02_2291 [Nematocida sp. AWRm79]|nr:hypothetical protein NEIRO02_2291 [Nematocida sp. AWRm79]
MRIAVKKIILTAIGANKLKAHVSHKTFETPYETNASIFYSYNNSYINPEGPLNQLYGYSVFNLGIIQKHRIKTAKQYRSALNYIQKKQKEESPTKHTEKPNSFYEDSEDVSNDFIDFIICTNKNRMSYNKIYCSLFPCKDKAQLIKNDSPGSFFMCLNAIDKIRRKNSEYLLAALLLISNGINIPLHFDENENRLTLIGSNKRAYLKINFGKPSKVYKSLLGVESLEVYIKQLVEVIDFFKKYEYTSDSVMNTAVDNTFNWSVLQNNYMYTSEFVIQMYIYDYCRSASSYMNLIECIKELMINCSEDSEDSDNSNILIHIKKTAIYNKLFVENYTEREKICLKNFYNMLYTVNNIKPTIPYSDINQIPMTKKERLIKNPQSSQNVRAAVIRKRNFETALLVLFSCFTYDCRSNCYKTSSLTAHRNNRCLHSFFNLEATILSTSPSDLHRMWVDRVLNTLIYNKINYRKRKSSGVLSILHAVSKISMCKKEIREEIKKLKKEVNSEEPLNSTFYEKVRLYTENLFKLLSYNKEVSVKFSNIYKERAKNKVFDLVGSVSITYTYRNIISGVNLIISSDRININIIKPYIKYTPSRKLTVHNLKDMCPYKDTLVSYIFNKYIDSLIKTMPNGVVGMKTSV